MKVQGNNEPKGEGGIELERIIFFSDAVFAIAITLLVLDVRLPPVEAPVTGQKLFAALGDSEFTSALLSFFVSFMVIGIYWLAHHRYFRFIRSYDHRLMWRNLFFLLTIVFLPVPTSILGKFGDQPVAVSFYALSVALAGCTLTWLWLYAARNPALVEPKLEPRFIDYYAFRALVPSVIFVLSVPLAFFNPFLTELSWLLVPLTRPLLGRFYGYQD